MAKAVKTPKTNAMRELESAGISYVPVSYTHLTLPTILLV